MTPTTTAQELAAACYTAAQELASSRPALADRVRQAGLALMEQQKAVSDLRDLVGECAHAPNAQKVCALYIRQRWSQLYPTQ